MPRRGEGETEQRARRDSLGAKLRDWTESQNGNQFEEKPRTRGQGEARSLMNVSRNGQEVREPTQTKEESRKETENSEGSTRRWKQRPIGENVKL